MNQAERAKGAPATVLPAQSSSVSAVHLPPLFTRDFTLLCLVTLGYFFSFFFFFPTLPFYIKHLGGREADVGLLIGISSLVSFSVKPLAGRWVDRHGRVPVISAAAGLFACGAVLHVWALRLEFLFVLRILYGTAIGCFSTAAGAWGDENWITRPV